VTATSATLTWTAATDNVGVTGYDIVRISGGSETTVAASTTNTASLTGLTADTAYTFAVYAHDAAGNRSARSATVNVTTDKGSGTPGTACSVGYRVAGEWPGGFQGEIVLHNTGTATLNGWKLAFAFPSGQTVSNMWGGTPTQSGGTVSVVPASYTSTIPAGGSVTLGFIAAKGATNTAPTAFTLNGSTCTTA
jgi:mannan endo-1,4-beta-mannosidase